jgi:hypothetical protein
LEQRCLLSVSIPGTEGWALNSPVAFSVSDVGDLSASKTETFYYRDNLPDGTEVVVGAHRLSQSELVAQQEQLGTASEGVNYNVIVDGHGTGYRPPTESEWATIAAEGLVIDEITRVDSRLGDPPSVDWSTSQYFPPIGDQDGEGSCTTWAVAYYTKTFQEAMEHGWDLSGAAWEGGDHPSLAYQDEIFSPDFLFHQINGGYGPNGSSYYRAIEVIADIGAATWSTMPYNPGDSTTWPAEAAWREAPVYRGDGGYHFLDVSSSVDALKTLLAGGNLGMIAVDADDIHEMATLDNFHNTGINHAQTLVGYDDNWAYTEEGATHYGAFKVANSWGPTWLEDGCWWISYAALEQRVGEVYYMNDRSGYNPETIAAFEINHPVRGDTDVVVGLGTTTAPTATKSFDSPGWSCDGNDPYPNNPIILDITECNFDLADLQPLFIEVMDAGTAYTGTIASFAVECYTDYLNGILLTSSASTDTPVNTVQGGMVYAEIGAWLVSGIDLLGTSFDVQPDNLLAAAGQVNSIFTVANQGDTGAGAFDVKFYLSDDATIDPTTDIAILPTLDPSDPNYDPSDPYAYRVSGGLASLGAVSDIISLLVPVSDPFGTDNDYYLGMFVDADADVDEGMYETNNLNRGQGFDFDDVYYVGPVDHFDWAAVSDPQIVGEPFELTITARDSTGLTVTDFSGTANLSGWIGSASTVVISEVDTGSSDAIEFTNVSGTDIDISGWQITVYDWDSYPSPQLTFTIPAGVTCTADETFVLHESGVSPGVYPDFYTGLNVYWNNYLSGNPVAVILRDDSGNIVDVMCAVDTDLSAIIDPTSIPPQEWQGAPVAGQSNESLTYQRIGDQDNSDATDWTSASPSLGSQNADLIVPFDVAEISITPTVTGSFVNGVWTGYVTVNEESDDMFLRADDGSGHKGDSNRFDVLPVSDFGDAPDPSYPVLLANGGARHTIVPGFFLGSGVDAEPDGQPDPAALGDDNAGISDDEDGVVFTSIVAAGRTATMDVTASAPGLLNAWLDFNCDGDWDDAGEQIFTDTPLVAGVNPLGFAVPVTPTDVTYARFRFSTAAGLSYQGPAPDGEVEDYALGAISGTKWNDLDTDGVNDPGEPGLEGWTVYLDTNGDGQYVVAGGVEPDDFDVGTLLNTVNPGATLSAIGSSSNEVYAGPPFGGYTSTGIAAFTRNGPYGWGSSIKLRADFSTLVDTVSIDAISDDALDVGILEAYDASGSLLGTYTTGGLGAGAFETMTISRLAPDIAYVIAGGATGDVINLDNLQFSCSDPHTTTDADGHYSIGGLPPDTYTVAEVQQPGWEQTYPVEAGDYQGAAVSFDFEDISATGHVGIAPSVDDSYFQLTAANLGGFQFEFFGTTYDSLFVSSNGLITFGSGSSAYTNTNLTASPSQAAIAAFWDDLYIDDSESPEAALLWEVRGSGSDQRLILQWHEIRFFENTGQGAITFQAILNESDGSIQFNYLDLQTTGTHSEGTSATVGIKDVGSQGDNQLLLSFNSGPNMYVGTGKSTRISLMSGGPIAHTVAVDPGEFVPNVDFGNLALPLLPGDYNDDNAVDAADYTVWRDALGDGAPRYSGPDGSGNGIIDDDDYLVWKANFGHTVAPGAGALAAGGSGAITATQLPALSGDRANSADDYVLVSATQPLVLPVYKSESRADYALATSTEPPRAIGGRLWWVPGRPEDDAAMELMVAPGQTTPVAQPEAVLALSLPVADSRPASQSQPLNVRVRETDAVAATQQDELLLAWVSTRSEIMHNADAKSADTSVASDTVEIEADSTSLEALDAVFETLGA